MVSKKSFKIIWDRSALDDFKETLNFLSKQSPEAPKIVKGAIIARLDTISTNALICEVDKLKDISNKDFRAFVVYSYRLTYQIRSDLKEIRVLRVRHTSQEPLGY